jgi:hypothetical protein
VGRCRRGAARGEHRQLFLNGGDLFILADDSVNDPINAALGIPTVDSAGSGVPKPTTGNAPLHAGPFGAAAVVNQLGAIGRLDVFTVLARNGHIVGSDASGNVSAAVWDRGQYAPGAGRLVIVTDVDMMVSGFPGALASYAPAQRQRALHPQRHRVPGQQRHGQRLRVRPFRRCRAALSRQAASTAYCGATGFTVTHFLKLALEDTTNFGGPGAPVARRATLVEFDSFTPELASRLKVVLIPWIQKLPTSDAASYATQVRDWYLAGGNLWLLQDDPFHDPIGELLGVPTPIARGSSGRPTNGVCPCLRRPFGVATDVMQVGSVGGLDPAQVTARGGTIVGHASDGTNDAVVAVWARQRLRARCGPHGDFDGRRFALLRVSAAPEQRGVDEEHRRVPADRPRRHDPARHHCAANPAACGRPTASR